MKNRMSSILLADILLFIVVGVPFYFAKAAPPSYLNVIPLSNYNIDSTGFTVEFWVKFRSKPGFDPRIVSVVNRQGGLGCGTPDLDFVQVAHCNLSCPGQGIGFGIVDQGACSDLIGTTPVDDSIFHHVAVTYDDTTMKIYIDGVLDASLTAQNVRSKIAGGYLTVGNNVDLANAFDGQIDELRIWKVARTQSEIQTNMSTEISVQPNLVAYWRFNGNSADLVARNNLCSGGDISYVGGVLGQAVDVSNPSSGPVSPFPKPCYPSADLNCDGNVSPADVVIELNMTFLGASPPC